MIEMKKIVVVVGFESSLFPPQIDRPSEDAFDQVTPDFSIIEILVPQIGLQLSTTER